MAIRYLLIIPSVQTWVVQRVAGYLSSELGTTVSIGKVDIKLFRSIVIDDIFIEDLQHDTLIYSPKLTATFSQFSIPKRRITIQSAVLDHARIGIKYYKEPREYNLDFLINYFSGNTKDTSASTPWKIKVENIKLLENTLSYRDFKYSDYTRCIDWEDIYLDHLNVDISNLEPDADTLNFITKHLSFRDKSGFKVDDFSAKAKITPQSMNFEGLRIITANSELHANIHFDFTDIEDFSDFIKKVKWKGSFDKSKIAFNDLAFFASELFGLNRSIQFKGNASGTVDRFKAKNLEISYTPSSYFKGDVNMTGLPDFDETYMEVSVNDLSINKKDIETIPEWPFESGTNINLPVNLTTLGTIHFKGKFNGFYNDFVAYGNTSTALGYISSDINLKIGEKDKNTTYSGSLSLFDFDMGKLWKLNPELGLVSMKAKVKGNGFELKNLDANLEGDISKIQLYDYNYSNINLKGHIGKRLFNGDISINDPNLNLDFQGDIDLRTEIPVFNFNSSIHNAHLSKINLINRDTSANFSAEVSINLVGNTIDNAQGTIQLDDVHYTEQGATISDDHIFIESRINNRRELTLVSNLIDAQVVGNFTLSDFVNSARWVLTKYIPAGLISKNIPPQNQNINFHLETKNTKGLTDMFFPSINISPRSILEGNMNTGTNSLQVLFNSEKINIASSVFDKVQIQGITQSNQLILNSSIHQLTLGDSLKLNFLRLTGQTNRDSSSLELSLSGTDSLRSNAVVRFDTHFLNTGYTTIKAIPSKLLLKGNSWTIDPSNYILFDTTGVLLEHFNFSNTNQHVDIGGIITKDTTGKVHINFKEFESDQLNDLLALFDVQIGGNVNGDAVIGGILGKPILNSDLLINRLSWFADTLGDAQVNTNWNSTQGFIDVNGVVTRGGDKNILINGKYYFKDKGDEIDFDINLQKTYIQSFAHYLKGIFSNIGGIASAKLKLAGPIKNPQLTGHAILQKVSFMVDYLKTTYNFSTEVELENNSISFKDIIVNDIRGRQSLVSGKITHDHLRDFNLDINIEAKNAQVLNTSISDNELFYGKAYASGKIRIYGLLDYLKMQIGLKSEEGTKIFIPLSNPEEVGKSSFITFMVTDSTLKAKTKQDEGPDFSGVDLYMDFEITPDAEVSLIFDSKIGDVIEGNGRGNLTMMVSPSEDFKMYGNFEIEKGKYLFTLQNIINKPFIIEKGGYIRWSGDPYDAYVNIDAAYKLNTSLYNLFQDSTYRKLVPVELKLHLTDKLFAPNIAFDINVQNIDPTIETQVKRYINTEEEKYRQAVALLVTRGFTSPSELSNKAPVSSGSVVGTNAYELLSNQLSNWASQISQQVNVGVNYNPGGALSPEELKVALSTSILNDKVTIDGNVGYSNAITANNQNTSSLVGDFNVEVKASKDGRIRLKAFNRSNNNSLINNINSPYTQGVGVFYREEFNSLNELTQRFRNWFKRKKAVDIESKNNPGL